MSEDEIAVAHAQLLQLWQQAEQQMTHLLAAMHGNPHADPVALHGAQAAMQQGFGLVRAAFSRPPQEQSK